MSQRDAWLELRERDKETGKARMRTMTEHGKEIHPLTGYTHMFDPMGFLTECLGAAHACKMKWMQAQEPRIRFLAMMVADLYIEYFEWQMSRWQGRDKVYYDDDAIRTRSILFQARRELIESMGVPEDAVD